MRKQHLITVVVPVYNVSAYLRDCIETILIQTYKKIEIILVDDGSTDDSGQICDVYAEKDNRIRVIHKQNGGLSSARNAGLDIATGEYITFVDSDDYLSKYYLQVLHDTIVRHQAQICLCDFLAVTEESIPNYNGSIQMGARDMCLTYLEAIKNVYSDKYHGIDFVAWAKLYSMDLFRESELRYPEGKLHEDTFITYKLFYMADKIAYVDENLYYYRKREGSITTSAFNVKRLDMLTATREECDFFIEKGEEDLTKLAVVDHLHRVKFIVWSILSSPEIDKKVLRSVCVDLRQDLQQYKKYISMKRKLYYRGLTYFPRMIVKI